MRAGARKSSPYSHKPLRSPGPCAWPARVAVAGELNVSPGVVEAAQTLIGRTNRHQCVKIFAIVIEYLEYFFGRLIVKRRVVDACVPINERSHQRVRLQ